MAQLITWRPGDWNNVHGWIKNQHVVTLEWTNAGGWRIRGVALDAGLKPGKFDTREGVEKAAEVWWLSALESFGAVPAPPETDLEPDSVERLVTDIRAAVLRHASVEYHVYRRRAAAAVAYMDKVISPSQITLDHIRRHLDGTHD